MVDGEWIGWRAIIYCLRWAGSNMKANFGLMLLANGLLICLTSAAAQAQVPSGDRDLASLSQTIARSIGFDRDTDSLIELAIDRALIAQQLTERNTEMRTAGVPLSPQDSRQTNKKPLIGGKIPAPTQESIGQVKNKKTTTPKLLQPPISGDVMKIDRH